jgi:hypothetical protein
VPEELMQSEAEVASHADRIRTDGYTVLERVVAPNWSRI